MISFDTIDEAIARIDIHQEKRYWHFIRKIAYTAPPFLKDEQKLFLASLILILVESPYMGSQASLGLVLRYTRNLDAWLRPHEVAVAGDWLPSAALLAMIADVMDIIRERDA